MYDHDLRREDGAKRRVERELRRADVSHRRFVIAGWSSSALVALVSAAFVLSALNPRPEAVASGRRAPAVLASSVATAAPARSEAASPLPGALGIRPAAPRTEPEPEPEPKPSPESQRAPKPQPKPPATQKLRVAIGGAGYEPSRLTARKGTPIVLTVGRGEGCAAGFNIPKLDVRVDNSAGDRTVSLGRLDAGSYTFTCDMGMVSGTLVVR